MIGLREGLRVVLSSLLTHLTVLIVFVDHPGVPMDNNASERGIRKGVIGRNNYYGSGRQWSAHLMTGVLTIVQTLLLWGIDPRHWMHAFLSACAENAGQPPADLSSFLPWAMDEQRKQFLSRPLPQGSTQGPDPPIKNRPPPDTC